MSAAALACDAVRARFSWRRQPAARVKFSRTTCASRATVPPCPVVSVCSEAFTFVVLIESLAVVIEGWCCRDGWYSIGGLIREVTKAVAAFAHAAVGAFIGRPLPWLGGIRIGCHEG